MLIDELWAPAGYFFVNGEQQTDLAEAVGAQSLSRRDLASDDPLGIAGSTAVNKFVVFTRRNERRHGVHVRREHNPWSSFGRGNHVRSFGFDVLQLNMIAEAIK